MAGRRPRPGPGAWRSRPACPRTWYEPTSFIHHRECAQHRLRMSLVLAGRHRGRGAGVRPGPPASQPLHYHHIEHVSPLVAVSTGAADSTWGDGAGRPCAWRGSGWCVGAAADVREASTLIHTDTTAGRAAAEGHGLGTWDTLQRRRCAHIARHQMLRNLRMTAGMWTSCAGVEAEKDEARGWLEQWASIGWDLTNAVERMYTAPHTPVGDPRRAAVVAELSGVQMQVEDAGAAG